MNLGRLLSIFGFLFLMNSTLVAKQRPQYYQLKIYHFETLEQQKVIDAYLKDAYLPTMHKFGFKHIGVFKPRDGRDFEKKIYVFTYANSLEQFSDLNARLLSDKAHLRLGADYLNASHNEPPYSRLEIILMKAFEGQSVFKQTKVKGVKKDRIYELRSYESANEKLAINKIKMFNSGEIEIFNQLDFNAVFYGEVISGANMPNLMYLTTFENQADRDAHWKAFGPAYKPMSQMPEYQNNVSKNTQFFLCPTDYSDI